MSNVQCVQQCSMIYDIKFSTENSVNLYTVQIQRNSSGRSQQAIDTSGKLQAESLSSINSMHGPTEETGGPSKHPLKYVLRETPGSQETITPNTQTTQLPECC